MVHIRLEDIEYYAKSNNIPIMLKDGINFLTEYIKNNNIKKIEGFVQSIRHEIGWDYRQTTYIQIDK